MDIISKFHIFIQENKDAYCKLSDFFNNERKIFEQNKIDKYCQNNQCSIEEATIKARQSWVSTLGKMLEDIIEILIKDFCDVNHIRITKDHELKKKTLSKNLDIVRRKILVHFNDYSVLPDSDLILYQELHDDVRILAILSIKNSFRERYTETPYWKMKLLENEITKHIKVFLITPDNDDEISFISSHGPRKSRIVMEYELDGLYLAKDTFHGSEKIKSIQQLIPDLAQLLTDT